MLAYANRACGLCMEQLLLLYGTMLFVQKEPLGRHTPRQMASDLEVSSTRVAHREAASSEQPAV
jgi:hypothetical protein